MDLRPKKRGSESFDLSDLHRLEQEQKMVKDLLPGYKVCSTPSLLDANIQTELLKDDISDSIGFYVERESLEGSTTHTTTIPSHLSIEEWALRAASVTDEAYLMPDFIGMRFTQKINILLKDTKKTTTINLNPENVESDEIVLRVSEWPLGELYLSVGGYEIFPQRALDLPHYISISTEQKKFSLEEAMLYGVDPQFAERERAAWRQREKRERRERKRSRSWDDASFRSKSRGELGNKRSRGLKSKYVQTLVHIGPHSVTEDNSELTESILKQLTAEPRNLRQDRSRPSMTEKSLSESVGKGSEDHTMQDVSEIDSRSTSTEPAIIEDHSLLLSVQGPATEEDVLVSELRVSDAKRPSINIRREKHKSLQPNFFPMRSSRPREDNEEKLKPKKLTKKEPLTPSVSEISEEFSESRQRGKEQDKNTKTRKSSDTKPKPGQREENTSKALKGSSTFALLGEDGSYPYLVEGLETKRETKLSKKPRYTIDLSSEEDEEKSEEEMEDYPKSSLRSTKLRQESLVAFEDPKGKDRSSQLSRTSSSRHITIKDESTHSDLEHLTQKLVDLTKARRNIDTESKTFQDTSTKIELLANKLMKLNVTKSKQDRLSAGSTESRESRKNYSAARGITVHTSEVEITDEEGEQVRHSASPAARNSINLQKKKSTPLYKFDLENWMTDLTGTLEEIKRIYVESGEFQQILMEIETNIEKLKNINSGQQPVDSIDEIKIINKLESTEKTIEDKKKQIIPELKTGVSNTILEEQEEDKGAEVTKSGDLTEPSATGRSTPVEKNGEESDNEGRSDKEEMVHPAKPLEENASQLATRKENEEKPSKVDLKKQQMIGSTDSKLNLKENVEKPSKVDNKKQQMMRSTDSKINLKENVDNKKQQMMGSTDSKLNLKENADKPSGVDNKKQQMVGSTDSKFNLKGNVEKPSEVGNKKHQMMGSIDSKLNLEENVEKPSEVDNKKQQIMGSTDSKLNLKENVEKPSEVGNKKHQMMGSTDSKSNLKENVDNKKQQMMGSTDSKLNLKENLEKPFEVDNKKLQMMRSTDSKSNLRESVDNKKQQMMGSTDSKLNLKENVDNKKQQMMGSTDSKLNLKENLEKPSEVENKKLQMMGSTDSKSNLRESVDNKKQQMMGSTDSKLNLKENVEKPSKVDNKKHQMMGSTDSKSNLEENVEKRSEVDNKKRQMTGSTDSILNLINEEKGKKLLPREESHSQLERDKKQEVKSSLLADTALPRRSRKSDTTTKTSREDLPASSERINREKESDAVIQGSNLAQDIHTDASPSPRRAGGSISPADTNQRFTGSSRYPLSSFGQPTMRDGERWLCPCELDACLGPLRPEGTVCRSKLRDTHTPITEIMEELSRPFTRQLNSTLRRSTPQTTLATERATLTPYRPASSDFLPPSRSERQLEAQTNRMDNQPQQRNPAEGSRTLAERRLDPIETDPDDFLPGTTDDEN